MHRLPGMSPLVVCNLPCSSLGFTMRELRGTAKYMLKSAIRLLNRIVSAPCIELLHSKESAGINLVDAPDPLRRVDGHKSHL